MEYAHHIYRDRLSWVIRLRFIVIAVLAGSYLINMPYSPEQPLLQIWWRGSFILSLTVVVIAANIIWMMLLRKEYFSLDSLAYYQCIFDLLAVSIVVYRHGVSGMSGYLFVFVILLAGVILPRRGIILVAFSSVVLYFAFYLLEITGRTTPIPSFSDGGTLLPDQIVFIINVAIKGFFFFLVAFATANMQDLLKKMTKESEFEKRFNEAVIRVVPTGLIVFDSGQNVVLYNPAMEQITMIPEAEAVGKNLMEVFEGIDDSWQQALEKAENDIQEVRLLGAQLPTKRGKLIRVNARIQPLTIQGQTLGTLCTVFSSTR